MTNKEQKELETVKNLLKEAYGHLIYCGFGDSWERECSKDLQIKLDCYFNKQ